METEPPPPEDSRILDLPTNEFLDRFVLPAENSSIVIDTRALLNKLDQLGYVLNENLPPQDRPDLQDMSLIAYLQVTQGVSDRIAVLDLAEFNQLLMDSMQKRYPWFHQAIQGQIGITADELLERAHRIVRDPAGVLRRTPVETGPPQLTQFGSASTLTSEILRNISDLVAKQMEFIKTHPPVPRMVFKLPGASAATTGESSRTRGAELEPPSNDDAASSLRSAPFTMDTSELGETPEAGDMPAAEYSASAPSPPEVGSPQAPPPPTTTPKLTRQRTKTSESKREEKPEKKKHEHHRSEGKRPRIQHEKESTPKASSPDKSASTPAAKPKSSSIPTVETTSRRGGDRRAAAIQSEIQRRTASQLSPDEEEPVDTRSTARKSKQRVSSSSSSEVSPLEEEGESDASCVMVAASEKTKGKKSSGSRASSTRSAKKQAEPAAAAAASAEGPPVPEEWKQTLKTVAIPGRRALMLEKDKLGKSMKAPVRVFKASQLAGRVDAIYTELEHGTLELFAGAYDSIKARWNAVHGHLVKIDAGRTRSFLAEVQWKLFANFHRYLWKCYGPRIATPEEKAAYNLMAHLPRDLVPIKNLVTKARKEIGETADFLEASDDNQLLPRDIWTRLVRELDGLDDFEHRLLALEGRDITAIVCSGLPNACAVYKLINEYSKEAAGQAGELHSIELSNEGTLQLAKMAQDFISWHFGVEDLVTEALDMDSIGRSTRIGTHKTPSSLDHYLGEPPYPVERDIELVECSCRADVLATLRAASLPSSLGIQVNKWRANEATSSLRLPVLLSLGACCSAFSPREPCNAAELERFIAAFKELVQANGVNYDNDPKPIEERQIFDKTLDRDVEEMAHPVDSLGPVRHANLLLDTSTYLPGGTHLQVRSGLILVSRIALLKPTADRPFHKPHVMTLILANGYGRPLAICDSGPQNAIMPAGVIDYNGRRTTQAEMRRLLLHYLAANNVLVGFHVGWTLAALELVLPATRVVDLGTEDAFQVWCRHMAAQLPGWKETLVEHLINSYDRRLPAVLFKGGIELRPAGNDDALRETYYTAALWEAVVEEIADLRARPDVYHIKGATPVGAGTGVTVAEGAMLFQHRNLVARADAPDIAELKCEPAKLAEVLEASPVDTLLWGLDMENDRFLQQCVELAAEGARTLKRIKPWSADFGTHGERCQIAVQVALPSLAVTASANLLLPWINHSSNLTVAELRSINLKEPRLRSRVGCRLITCWLDFAVRPAEFTAATNTQGGPAVGHVMPPAAAGTGAESSASSTRPRTPPDTVPEQAPASAAATPATAPPPPVHQPVSLAPVADWLIPPRRGRGAAAPTGNVDSTAPATDRPASAASTRSLPSSPRPAKAAPAPKGPVESTPPGDAGRLTRSRTRGSPAKKTSAHTADDDDV